MNHQPIHDANTPTQPSSKRKGRIYRFQTVNAARALPATIAVVTGLRPSEKRVEAQRSGPLA